MVPRFFSFSVGRVLDPEWFVNIDFRIFKLWSENDRSSQSGLDLVQVKIGCPTCTLMAAICAPIRGS
jgi:hypothetical protein